MENLRKDPRAEIEKLRKGPRAKMKTSERFHRQNGKSQKGSTGRKENLRNDPQAKIPLVLETFLAVIMLCFHPVRNDFVDHLGDLPAFWSNLWSNSSVCDPPSLHPAGSNQLSSAGLLHPQHPQPVFGRVLHAGAPPQQENGAVGSWSKPQEMPGMGETWLQGLFPALPMPSHHLLVLLHRGMRDGETQEWHFSGAALVLAPSWPVDLTHHLLKEPPRGRGSKRS